MELFIVCVIMALLYMLLGALSQFSFETEFCTDKYNYPKLYALKAKDREALARLVFLFWPIPFTVIIVVLLVGLVIWCVTAPFIAIGKLGESFKTLFKLFKGGK